MAENRTLKYLIDVGHPAHVHYFKNLAFALTENGHDVVFTCRDKDVTVQLLQHYKFNYISFGRPYRSVPGKLFGIVYFTFRILVISISLKPEMFLNATIYSAFAAWILRKPHISLEDTFNMEQVRFYLPFTSCVLTGDYKHPSLGKKEISFAGYQELLYLHPQYFKPDFSILRELSLSTDEAFVLIRFVSWTASHDILHKGISYNNKILAVREFSKYVRVFISSESELPESLKEYHIDIDPHRMHDVMAFASLIFGESATMATEGAMLGTPGIFLDNTGRYYTKDLEDKYGLIFNFSESEDDQLRAIEKGAELLKQDQIRRKWSKKHSNMLSEKINVSKLLVWFVEKWPESFNIMKKNPDFQKRFS